jgi:hypothetical protein
MLAIYVHTSPRRDDLGPIADYTQCDSPVSVKCMEFDWDLVHVLLGD